MSNIYWESFKTFFKIGIFTLGGGYAMIPLIEEEVVNKHRWVEKEEMLDLIAIAQSCPGVFAINIAIFIGYKLRQERGAIATSLGTALPSFLIILAIAIFFKQFEDNRIVAAIFRGIRPAVVALIAVPTFRHHRRYRWLYLWEGKQMIFLSLFITFFKIGLFGFGGGYGMLSLIQHETVESHHWLSTAEFTDIVAISQMTPGPIGINSATYCGYTAIENAGYSSWMAVLGSATATFALVLPSLILMILISKMFMKYMKTSLVQSVFTGLRPAVVGLLAAATLLLCNEENFSTPKENPWQFFISCALLIATAVGTGYLKINPIRMICYAGIAGLLLLY